MENAVEEIKLQKDESFRDAVNTVDKEGKRIWIYPKKSSGILTKYRTWFSYFYLLFFVAAPFIYVNNEPLILINIPERHFAFFGLIFWPEDFHIFLVGTITFIVFIILFTVIYGRVFCGWACPQTIFMEMVFRKIEYWIEGDWKTQMRLDQSTLTLVKFLKKSFKHTVFFILSFVIANFFLIYIIGYQKWMLIAMDNPLNHLGGLSSILAFTGIFYWVYAKFREQVCTVVCPYGRLQGVLLDKDSIIVAYDYKRGEPRALVKKGEDRAAHGKGDCIDCHHCVDVCPTGIDIRNGTQMECINCTACIDACNFMMEKVGLEKGLVRYASENSIANNKKFKWTKKTIAYTGVLTLLIIVFSSMVFFRSDVEAIVLRAPGFLYQERENNEVSNLFSYKLINKTHQDHIIYFQILEGKGRVEMVGHKELILPKAGIFEGALFVLLSKEKIKNIKTDISIGVYSDDKLLETVHVKFLGPVN